MRNTLKTKVSRSLTDVNPQAPLKKGGFFYDLLKTHDSTFPTWESWIDIFMDIIENIDLWEIEIFHKPTFPTMTTMIWITLNPG